MPLRTSYLAVLLGVLAAICISAALISFPNHDGISTDLAGALVVPLQAINTPPAKPFFQAGGFEFGEGEAIKLVLISSIIFALLGLFLCCSAAKANKFTSSYSISFLLCVGSLILGYFNFGFLLSNA